MKRNSIILLLLICFFGVTASSSGASVNAAEVVVTSDSEFITRLFNGQITKIKLIGDSITEGNGARNYSHAPTGNPVIFDNGAGIVFHEPNFLNTSWSNKFREFIKSDFPDVQFINAGIGGKSAKWANANKQNWVSDAEDVVFVMLGTNDRWDSASPTEFKTNLESFLSYIKARSNLMIVMTANPTQNDNVNTTYNFGMNEVDRVITEVCERNGYEHISLYREMLSYSETSGATLKTLIEEGGSHPINEGHDAMWRIIQERLGFVDKTSNWNDGNPSSLYTVLMGAQYPYVKSTTPISFFDRGKRTVIELESYSDISNFPEKTTGWLTTTRGFTNDLYSNQTWEPRESYNIYKRTWNFGSSTWNEWKKLNGNDPTKTTVSVTPGQINSDSVKEVEVLVTGLDKNKTPTCTVIGTLPAGIMTSTHVDYTANRVYLRLFNATSSVVDVGKLDVVCIQMDLN